MFRQSPYSFGITLKDFIVTTTNENWLPEYIDRTEEANRARPLHKRLTLGDLAFYWEAEGASMVSAGGNVAEIEAELQKVGTNIPRRNYILKPCKTPQGTYS